MKIERIEAFPFDLHYTPTEEFLVTYFSVDAMQNAVVRITTDDGLTGHGELMPVPLDSRTERLEDLKKLAPALLGQDPFEIREIYARIDENLSEEGTSQELLLKGALDTALHDIMGKAAGVPVYQLLGGSYDDGVPMHFTISIRSPEEMAEDAARRVAEGFRTLEVKLGRFEQELDLDTEIARIAAIREAVGPEVCIVADPNTGWTVEEAMEVLPSLEEFDIYIEQPVEGIDALAEIRSATSSPVVADESALTCRSVAEVVRRDAADLINVKILRIGGLYEACRMLDMCEALEMGYRHDNVIQSRLASTMMIHFATTYDSSLPDGGGTQFTRTVEDLVSPDEGVYLEGGTGKLRDPDAPGMGVSPRAELLGDPVLLAGHAS